MTGAPVSFRFFSSLARSGDVLGTVVSDAPGQLEELDPIQVTLPTRAGKAPAIVPVKVQGTVSEVGTLELAMVGSNDQDRWELEFDTRSSLSKRDKKG